MGKLNVTERIALGVFSLISCALFFNWGSLILLLLVCTSLGLTFGDWWINNENE